MFNIIGALIYRAALSFYFAIPLEKTLIFNGVDIVCGLIAFMIFKWKQSEPIALIIGHSLGCMIAFFAVKYYLGSMNPLAAITLTLGSVLISELLLKMRKVAI
jgi:surfactin synthase thioesterase subunit